MKFWILSYNSFDGLNFTHKFNAESKLEALKWATKFCNRYDCRLIQLTKED